MLKEKFMFVPVEFHWNRRWALWLTGIVQWEGEWARVLMVIYYQMLGIKNG